MQDYEVNGDVVLAIRIPRARREDKPVYINDDMMSGTFRRNGERAGSGVPDIFAVRDSQGWIAPEVEKQYDPDRTLLTLSLEAKLRLLK